MTDEPMSRQERVERMRARFQDRGRPGIAADSRRDARQTRRIYLPLATAASVICLVLIGVRLQRGDAVGLWLALYAVGALVSGAGALLAKRGHTRWALASVAVGVGLAGLGDAPTMQ
ncbi:hypothetical protein GTY65_36570 [Streptomyces sp. SID8379]|uniref:hypothetical protein n=1 Tax=unclassified Streptomyces TaxID=2593676 RepID=UPI00035CC3FD|nr:MULTISPECIES: hypothetical protein [unclassified Streptomyces]MYW69542.1 hypothetical protein [Streptomyces sp. SID8379]